LVASRTFISRSLTLLTYAFALSAKFLILLCAPGTYLQEQQSHSSASQAEAAMFLAQVGMGAIAAAE
jgi:hypothetical protein